MFETLLKAIKKFFTLETHAGYEKIIMINSYGCHTGMGCIVLKFDNHSSTYLIAF